MAMFYKNICRFDQCNLEFADLYHLIQHIEETHIPIDPEKKMDSQTQTVSAPLSAICRYFQKLPDQPARPIVPEPTFQQPTPSIPPGAQAAAGMVAAAAAASVKKRIPSIIAQSSSSAAGGGLVTTGGQSVSQTSVTPTTSILFHPPANVAVRSSGATPASHISDGDDESMSVGRESLSSESSMLAEEGTNETAALYKIISPTGSTDERRFVCAAPGCKKSYKNMNGIRYHIKIAHMHAGPVEPQPNAKKFRCQCGKAYKTSHGLHNHMLQTHHRQAPVPSSSAISNSAIGNLGATGAGNAKYATGMAGVSASASQFKRGLPVSLMAGGPAGSMSTAVGPKHQAQGPSSSAYAQQSAMKSGGSSNTTTLPSGVSVQVSNLGGGAPTTVQVGQQGALGVVAGSANTVGPLGSGATGAQGLHISAGRRLSAAAHHMQQQQMNSMGGRALKIHSSIASGPRGGVQGVVVGASSTHAGVSVYNSNAPSTVTTMGGSGGSDKADS